MNRGHCKIPRGSQSLQNLSMMTSPTTEVLHTGVKAHQLRPMDFTLDSRKSGDDERLGQDGAAAAPRWVRV